MASVSQGMPQYRPRTILVIPLEATLMGAIQKLIHEFRAQTLVARKCPSDLVRVKESYRGKTDAAYQLPSPDITSVGKTKVQSIESFCPVNRTPTRAWHCHTHPRPLEMSIRLQAGLAPQVHESLWTDSTSSTASPWNRHKLAWGQTGWGFCSCQ